MNIIVAKKLIKNLLPQHKEHKNGHDTYDAKTRENRCNAKQKADERYTFIIYTDNL